MWVIILVIVGVAIVLFVLFGLGAIMDSRDASRIKKDFINLLNMGSNEFDALVEISSHRHPELSTAVHKKIATKLGDIDKFVGFMQSAAEGIFWKKNRKLRDTEIYALLKATTLIHKGYGVYTTQIDRQLYERLLGKEW